MLTTTNVHNVSPADVSAAEVHSPGAPTVVIRFGDISVFITDTATLDALSEATTRAYELLAEAADLDAAWRGESEVNA